MTKEILRNAYAKKTIIFAVAFSMTCILMGFSFNTINGDANPFTEVIACMNNGQAIFSVLDVSNKQTPGMPKNAEYPGASSEPLPVKPLINASPAQPGEFVYSTAIPLSYDLQLYTYQACVNRQLDYELVLALMWRESRFQVDAVNTNTNGTQDSGIMQINDVNKQWLMEKHGIHNLMDPRQNIDAGLIMLGSLVKKYGAHDALMAYQYGEQGMQSKIANGVVTNDLIAKLISQRNVYKALLSPESSLVFV